MRQLIEDLISMMEYHVEQTRPIHSTTVALQAAREALKAMPTPVACECNQGQVCHICDPIIPPQRTEQGEPVIDKSAAIRIATALGWTPPEQERNFCPRCGKRTNYIHTCTPPRDNT